MFGVGTRHSVYYDYDNTKESENKNNNTVPGLKKHGAMRAVSEVWFVFIIINYVLY